jgi:hypothetical protein
MPRGALPGAHVTAETLDSEAARVMVLRMVCQVLRLRRRVRPALSARRLRLF